MTTFAKARWATDGDQVHLGMDFSKVDKQRRIVAGWATIDNVDTENDVVTAEASIDAFKRSRGNLREMHKKDSAVGKVVSFKEESFTAPDGNTYRGIFVKVRVSEGAQNTWLKVLDGTLSGFSIGGNIIESEEDFNKSGEKIRKVTKYDLNELSLVDNPGNQYSDITNVFKFRKSADGSVTSLTGMVEDELILNVFYCEEHQIIKESPSDTHSCPVDDEGMKAIGFIEDGSDRSEKVSTLVTKFVNGEGGVTMQKSRNEEVDGDKNVSQEGGGNPVDFVNDEEAAQADPTGPSETAADVNEVEPTEAPAEDVEEVHDESEEISKKIDSLKTDISDILNKNSKDTEEKIEALEKAVSETREFFDRKISELDNKFTGLNKDLETAKSRQDSLENSLRKINSSGAFKKSADLEESTETIQKSETGWGGHFDDPRSSGAFSVDGLFR